MRYEAPAKLNLSLIVHPPRDDGFHPLDSIVQTIEWCDFLEIREATESSLTVSEPGMEGSDNLVWEAHAAMNAEHDVPPVRMTLEKHIPAGAGLGGGSSDAAATLLATSRLIGIQPDLRMATELGADVALFLEGGTQHMTGIGDRLERLDSLAGFYVAVAVPGFELSTPEVYAEWDRLGSPIGPLVPNPDLPEALRDLGPIRNDLTPAALAIDDRLGDFMSDLARAWGRTVSMTGSGSGCFAYFETLETAREAAATVASDRVVARGVPLRSHGVD